MPPTNALNANADSLAVRTLVPADAVPRSENATDFQLPPVRLRWIARMISATTTVTTTAKMKYARSP